MKDYVVTKEEKNWAVLVHLSLLSSLLVPMAGVIAPIAIWLVKGKESEYVREQGKEAINLMICEGAVGLTLVGGFLFASAIGAAYGTGATMLLGLAAVALGVIGIILPVIAATRCSSGVDFKYPYIARIVK